MPKFTYSALHSILLLFSLSKQNVTHTHTCDSVFPFSRKMCPRTETRVGTPRSTHTPPTCDKTVRILRRDAGTGHSPAAQHWAQPRCPAEPGHRARHGQPAPAEAAVTARPQPRASRAKGNPLCPHSEETFALYYLHITSCMKWFFKKESLISVVPVNQKFCCKKILGL